MGDYISELPDEILSSILSFLTLKDAAQTRTLSRRWRYLSTPQTLLHLDDLVVFGKRFSNTDECSSKFVAAVDQLVLHRGIPRIGTLEVHFPLWNDCWVHINRWVEASINKNVEKIDFDFSHRPLFAPRDRETYNFPCHLLPDPATTATRFRHLSLKACTFELSSHFTNRLVCLSSLDLCDVPLYQSGLDTILSCCLNLTLLRLVNCFHRSTNFSLRGQLLSLKTLIIDDPDVRDIELNSIKLETFDFTGIAGSFAFVDVPLLKWLLLWQNCLNPSYQYASDLPQIQYLSLLLSSQVVPIPGLKYNGLKKLYLSVLVKENFNLLSIIYLLNASPCLEALHMQLGESTEYGIPGTEVREDDAHMYCHLKEVRIEEFCGRGNDMGLAKCLLRKAIALERMLIRLVGGPMTDARKRAIGSVRNVLRKEKINSTARIIVR